MATIVLTQTRTNETDGTYKIVNTLKTNVGIPLELFAMKQNTGEYDHVVNVGEITNLPTTDTIGHAFYRVSTFTKSFTDVASAVAFASELKRRIDLIINEYTTDASAFPGGEDTSFPLPTS